MQIWSASIKAFISFCLVSSSIYLLNDCIDKSKDKRHPTKKNRAIASGLVSVKFAIITSLILLLTSLIIGFKLNISFILVLVSYYLIQILYCLFLKNIPLVEFFCIAIGFILRSVAGGVASGIYISSWFLLSVGMLSLFLAVEKRKAEILNLRGNSLLTRKVLKNYSIPLINKFESILTSCTVMTYSLWAYGPAIGGSRSPLMLITIPFVIIGIFRYQMLSDTNYDYENLSKIEMNILETPENVIIKDKPMQIIIIIWLLLTIYIGLIT